MADGLRFGPLTQSTVHLCVDMQRMFAAGSAWQSPWVERTLPTIVRLAERSPERTVFTRFIPPIDGRDMPGMWQTYYARWPTMTRRHLDDSQIELLPSLARLAPPAYVVDKSTYSAFSAPALPQWLALHRVDGLIVTGAETDVCILSTVLAAVEFGYRVIVVTDGVCSSSDDTHDALLTLYHRRFSEQIEAAVADEVLDAWPPA